MEDKNKLWFIIVLFVLPILILGGVILYLATGDLKTENKNLGTNNQATTTIETSTTTATTSTQTSKNISNPKVKNMVILKTSEGDIKLELLVDKAPNTVANFLKLAESGFYNGTLFHRVIKDFMIQGGDPLSKGTDKSVYGTGGPGYTFADEINDVKLVKGILAMANAGPNTNGSQFFIVTAAATPWLDGHHTAFGRVVEGMAVVDKIGTTQTGANDLPVKEVKVESVIVE